MDHALDHFQHYMPHGHCYLWNPPLVALHVISDGLIGASYAVISVVLVIFWGRIRLPFNGVFLAFGAFIGACGLTHWMEIWNLWNADYWMGGTIKAVTAIASVSTAALSVLILPKASKWVDEARLSEARRIQLESEKEASAMKDRFLAMVSHELRSPLNVIIGYSDLLRTESLPAKEADEALAAIQRNAELQNRLIGDLLDVSRIVAGNLRLQIERVDLRSLIDDCLETIALPAKNKGVHVAVELEPGAVELAGDELRIKQVLLNLLSNSIKFTDRGGSVKLEVKRDRATLVIEVSDTGRGMSADFLPKVFERFTQAGTSRGPEMGLGLGLSIARHLVELHGGKIGAQSEGLGKGSKFKIVLPIKPLADWPAPSQARVGSHPLLADGARIDGVRVMLVEDDDDSRRLLCTALEMAGGTVHGFATAEEAISAFKAAPFGFDILVGDIDLPGADGRELIERIHSFQGTGARRLPGIALTAAYTPEAKSRALASGYRLYCQKPVPFSTLCNSVKQLLAHEASPTV